jgi:metallophosphoesterase (TIGR00282 family)
MSIVRAVMIGDVVGEPGLQALEAKLPEIIKEHNVNFTVVNGENIAGGFGMTLPGMQRILAAGADVVTSGNHVWEKRDFWQTLDSEERMLRPENYPPGSPGTGSFTVIKDDVIWITINLQGREYMTPIDCPFRSFDTILSNITGRAGDWHQLLEENGEKFMSGFSTVILVDFHAESTREKEALGYYLDGRVSLVAGTHTHVQTADERVLPKGTGYITDLGMTGITDSVIGMNQNICLERVRKQVLYRMEIAGSPGSGEDAAQTDSAAETLNTSVQGVLAEIDSRTGKTISLRRL